MRKLKLAFLAAVLLSVAGFVRAAMGTVSPYTADFDNVTPNQEGWLVGTSWGHIVDETNGATNYASASVMITYGTYAKVLQIGAQNGNTDVLVTPKVKGTVTLKAQRAAYNGSSIRFYQVTKSGDGYVLGDVIKEVAQADIAPLNTIGANAFTTITVTEEADGYIGIWGENVYIEDFTATSAEVELVPGLTIASFSREGTVTDVNAEGKFTVEFNVTVKNTGNVDLTVGSENYSVTLKKGGVEIPANVTAIPQDLAAGATSESFKVSATLDYDENEPEADYQVMENVTGTTYYYTVKVKPTPYKPVLKLAKGNTALTDESTQDFGLATTGATMTYTLSNEGAAPLNISAMAFSTADFTSDVTGAQTLAAHEKKTVTVTLAATEGTPSANLVITTDGGELAIPFEATILDASKYFEGFESGAFPDDFDLSQNKDSDGDAVWSVTNLPYNMGGNSSAKIARANSYGNENIRIITPLLESDGSKLTFDAASTPYMSDYLLVVAYSADKKDWTVLKTFDSAGLTSDFKQFSVKVPAGNYYVSFSGKKVNIDNIYGYKLATDEVREWAVSDVVVPAATKVGNETTVTAKLKNNGNVDEEAGSYTATLYVDGKSVATAEAALLAKNTTNDYTFTFTPAEAGDFKAYVEFKKGDYSVKSDEADISVAEAGAALEETVQVGEGTDNSSSIVYTQNSAYNEFVAIYPQSMLSGVASGNVLTKLTFRIANAAERSNKFQIYLENTSEETLAKPASETPDVTAMTKVFDGSSVVPEGGDDEDNEYIDWTFDLQAPFVYTGQSLRLVVFEQRDVVSNGGVYFNRTGTQNAYARNSNNETFVSYGYAASFSQKYLPILVLTTKAAAQPTTVSVTIAESGYSTLSSDVALDFAAATTTTDGADALTAYVATAVSSKAVTISEVTSAPAHEGVILKGTAGATYEIPLADAPAEVENNLLKAADTLAGDGTEYVLAGGEFHKATAGTVPAGKAYLKLSAALEARTLTIGDEATGISTVGIGTAVEGAVYNLQGVRIQQPTKGLYIVNGKKFFAK